MDDLMSRQELIHAPTPDTVKDPHEFSEPGNGLDGPSIVPLLRNLSLKWERHALTTREPDCCALRSDRWGYSRCKDGP